LKEAAGAAAGYGAGIGIVEREASSIEEPSPRERRRPARRPSRVREQRRM
jgi:hypothetical protein